MSTAFRETDFIAWATAPCGEVRTASDALAQGHIALSVGPGDDAAVLADGTLICMDATLEGVHFESGTDPELIVRKALGRALSDVCAMGGTAETVHVAALLPPGCDGRGLGAAIARWCANFGVALAGGDTKRSHAGSLGFVVAATGHCRPGPPWLRSGGRPGDRLCVSGALGGARGGRHLRVAPRADIVARLRADGVSVHACLDLSDGLSRNLRQLAAASGVGARVKAEHIPVHADVERGRDGVLAALADGEDFELLLALDPAAPLPEGLVEIGRLTADPKLWLVRDGVASEWPAGGFEHEF